MPSTVYESGGLCENQSALSTTLAHWAQRSSLSDSQWTLKTLDPSSLAPSLAVRF